MTKALETFDGELAGLLGALRENDLVFVTADHGCDPTDISTDHTREYVPLIVAGPRVRGARPLGTRSTFADLGATICELLDLPRNGMAGMSVLPELGLVPSKRRGGGVMKAMMTTVLAAMVAAGLQAQTENPAHRVAADAMVIDRVAEASKRDLPRDLLKRIVNEDIDLLRGKRTDGSYEYATWERFEAGRIASSFSIQARTDRMETVEVRGSFVYRVVVGVPERRLVVRKNRPIWIERVDADFVGEGSTQSQTRSIEVKVWMQPGEIRPIDLPVVARQATVKVIATADPKGGYGNVDVALVQAKIVDNTDSPHADAVSSAKAILRALDRDEVPSIRTMAQRLRDSLGGRAATAAVPARASIEVVAPQVSTMDAATRVELQAELQLIEDLLTGSETERRDGLDRLHRMIRRLRP